MNTGEQMEITQYFPNFVSGFEPEIVKFDDAEELKEIEFVKRWSDDDEFLKYSISEDDFYHSYGYCHLMAELDNGKKWFVVGKITGDVNKLDLPKWEMKKDENESTD